MSTNFDHPKFKELQDLGCSDRTQVKMTFLTYMDLSEVKNWWNIKANLSSDLNCLFITGHEGQKEVKELVLPMTSDASMTLPEMRQYLVTLQQQYDIDSLILAFVAEDWSINYFRITDGLVPPDPPEALEDKKVKRKQRWQTRQNRYVSLASMPDSYASQLPQQTVSHPSGAPV